MPNSCKNPDCSVVASGRCVLLHANPADCPEFTEVDGFEVPVGAPPTVEVVLPPEEIGRSFYSGLEMGTGDVAELMGQHYGKVIAILGQYDTGKTCLLASLYLLVASGVFAPSLKFAGSMTLAGFEARARRLRSWPKGMLPKQLADHTVLSDPRQPALMHLALVAEGDARHDLFLTDLPGEWTKDLVNDATTADRFAFVARADGIVITLDGPALKSSKRHAAVEDANLLISRLADTLEIPRDVPLVLMVSKADEIALELPAAIGTIEAHAKSLGFFPKIILVAAISRNPAEIKSGTGVRELVEYFMSNQCLQTPIKYNGRHTDRHFLRIPA